MKVKLNNNGSISIRSENIAEDIVMRGMMNNEAYISNTEPGAGGEQGGRFAKIEISFKSKKKSE